MSLVEDEEGCFTLRESALVHALVERCFALTAAVALVEEDLGMKPVSGRTAGLVQAGDLVRWEGWQLGMKHFHVSRISSYNKPVFLQDTMEAGRFRTFQHDHHLSETPSGTLLQDELRFSLPFGSVGRLVARFVMVPHIRKLLRNRFARITRLAEGEDWRKYVPQA